MRPAVTNVDQWYNAVFDYIVEQIDGRFRIQFPNELELIDYLIESFQLDFRRISAETMIGFLSFASHTMNDQLMECMSRSCTREERHNLLKEFIQLMWDAEVDTHEWLKAQGVIVGQSHN